MCVRARVRRLTAFLQQGAAEAASRVRERVSASLQLQTSESVHVFHWRVHVSRAGVWTGRVWRGLGHRKCTLADLFWRGRVSVLSTNVGINQPIPFATKVKRRHTAIARDNWRAHIFPQSHP